MWSHDKALFRLKPILQAESACSADTKANNRNYSNHKIINYVCFLHLKPFIGSKRSPMGDHRVVQTSKRGRTIHTLTQRTQKSCDEGIL